MVSNNEIQIVISRYNENLNWLNDTLFKGMKIIIYNKGNNTNFYKPNNCKIVNLPNKGRCDQTFLFHIAENYDNLEKITIFLPGSSDMPNKIYKTKKMMNFIINYKKAVFPVEKCSSVYTTFRNFTIENWESSYRENSNNNNNIVENAKLRPFGVWYNYHFGNKNCQYYSINSIFSLDKDDIKKYPKSRYLYFSNMLSNNIHPETCHYIERSWALIFGPFLNTLLLHV
jgi:hypothetical protein